MRKKDVQLYAALVSRAGLTQAELVDIDKIYRASRALHRINENHCNGWPRLITEYRDGKYYKYHVEDEEWRERDEARREKLEGNILAICKRNGWDVEIQGDPRGYPVRLEVNGVDVSFLVNHE